MKTKHDNDKFKTTERVSFTVKRDRMKLEIAHLLKILERKLQKVRTMLLTIMMRKMEIDDWSYEKGFECESRDTHILGIYMIVLLLLKKRRKEIITCFF